MGEIRELGLLRNAYELRVSKTTRQEVLLEIPITNFLQKSGMCINRLVVVYGRGKKEPTYDGVLEKIDTEDFYPSYFTSKIEGVV